MSKLQNLFILFLFFIANTAAQQQDFELALKTIEVNKPSKYASMDSVLKPFERDSLKMRRVLRSSELSNYNEGACYALNALGAINRNLSYYDKSIKLHLKAKDYAEKAKSDELTIISLNMIGVAYRRMDIIKPALDYHTNALKIAYAIINPSNTIKQSIAVSQNSIGNIYLALQQYDLAINQFKKSLAIETEGENKLGLAINYHNIGYAEEAMGYLDSALMNYEKSLEYNNAINSEIGRIICKNSIGGIYLKKENYKAAEPIITEALVKALIAGDQFYIASSYINLGKLKIELNQLDAAEQNLKQALKVAKDFNLKSSIAESCKLLAQINEKNENFETALDYYKEAVDIESTILTE